MPGASSDGATLPQSAARTIRHFPNHPMSIDDTDTPIFERLVELARLAQASPGETPEAVVEKFVNAPAFENRRLYGANLYDTSTGRMLSLLGVFHKNNHRKSRAIYDEWIEARPHGATIKRVRKTFGVGDDIYDGRYDDWRDVLEKDHRHVAAVVKMSRFYIPRNTFGNDGDIEDGMDEPDLTEAPDAGSDSDSDSDSESEASDDAGK